MSEQLVLPRRLRRRRAAFVRPAWRQPLAVAGAVIAAAWFIIAIFAAVPLFSQRAHRDAQTEKSPSSDSAVHPQGNGHSFLPSLSRSGRFVGFGSEASNLVAGDDEGQTDAFVADMVAGTVVRASQTAGGVGANNVSASTAAAISADGQSLVYTSYADNLVAGDRFDEEEAFVWRAAS